MLGRIRLKLFVFVVVVVHTVTSADSSVRHGFSTISVPAEYVMDIMTLGHVSVADCRFILVTVHDSSGQYAVSHHPWEQHNEKRSFL